MKAKMKHAKQAARGLTPKVVATYRAYPAMDAENTIAVLADFLAHGRLFQQTGAARLSAASERAWWGDAVVFAGEPAVSAEAARRKIEALAPALDGRSWRTADEGLRAMTAMITVAVEAERQRWCLAGPTRH